MVIDAQEVVLPSALDIYAQAIQMAEELDQIRFIYGDDCVLSVKRALCLSPSPHWRKVVDDAVRQWAETSFVDRINFDL